MKNDTDRHERAYPYALHPEVVEWCARMAEAARLYSSPKVIADFDRLLEFARNGR